MSPPACPRCGTALPVGEQDGCRTHGPVPPMWRPAEATYDELVTQLRDAPGLPTYLPWPMAPGWAVTDLAVVGGPDDARATMVGCSGASSVDGPVDLLVVLEDPGTGLGAARAGLPHDGPPAELFGVPPQTRVRAGDLDVRLWTVPLLDALPEPADTVVPDTPEALFGPLIDAGPDRAVLVGEAAGRWLWVMVRPASALLMLTDRLILADAHDLGPALVEVAFAAPPPAW